MDTRRVAFAWYLTRSWSKEDGGLLDLFDMDGLYAVFMYKPHTDSRVVCVALVCKETIKMLGCSRLVSICHRFFSQTFCW